MQMIFTVLYVIPVSISSVLFGYAADSRFRLLWFASSMAVLSGCQFLFPMAKSFTALAAIRVLGGLAEGSTEPISMVIIKHLFVKNTAKAMGIFNWAIYLAYAFTILFALLTKNSFRWSYYIIGICCATSVFALLIMSKFIVIKEENEKVEDEEESNLKEAETNAEESNWREDLSKILKVALKPATILILLGGIFRHTAGYTLGINQVKYFADYKVSII